MTSRVTPKAPSICGIATLTMLTSITTTKLPSNTVPAIIHLLAEARDVTVSVMSTLFSRSVAGHDRTHAGNHLTQSAWVSGAERSSRPTTWRLNARLLSLLVTGISYETVP